MLLSISCIKFDEICHSRSYLELIYKLLLPILITVTLLVLCLNVLDLLVDVHRLPLEVEAVLAKGTTLRYL